MLYCFQENKSGAPSCSQEKGSGALLFSKRRKLVHYCSQEKETGALLFLGEITGTIMFPREGNWCFTVCRRRNLVLQVVHKRRDLVLYCSQREGNWCTSVLKEKETGALLLMFSGEVDWCSTVLRRRAMKL